jgi:hypothetical protein
MIAFRYVFRVVSGEIFVEGLGLRVIPSHGQAVAMYMTS